jgi:MoaA/NifB/PqqE/SkfB family radical SAM enzyme
MNNPVSERPVQTRTFRLDVPLHKILTEPTSAQLPSHPVKELQRFPDPVFPQRPELLGTIDENDEWTPPQKRRWTPGQIYHTMQGWLFPYIRSRLTPGDFHPLIAYLFTEFKCNLDCHYCWAFDNKVKGMSEDTAKRSVDWLHGTGCRVLAYMGGEPLLRPDFVHRITYYAAKKNFWIYLPTNARLLRTNVVDKLADAGVSTFNIAVDAVDVKPGLPKALVPIRKQFDYLIRKQYSYGYSVFLNINVCRNNLDDVRQLTEIANDCGIATDYHINESPLLEQDDHFKYTTNNGTYITREDWPAVEETIQWLTEKQNSGYKMVNSNTRLWQMVDFMKGYHFPWNCRAGHNSIIIRVDGTLAPCFPMYTATYDWGTVGNHKFETKQLDEQKKSCQTHCFSTLNHILGWCYNDQQVIKYFFKQLAHGFQGMNGQL